MVSREIMFTKQGDQERAPVTKALWAPLSSALSSFLYMHFLNLLLIEKV